MSQVVLIEVECLLSVWYIDSRGDYFMVLYTRFREVALSLVELELSHYAQYEC